MTNSLFSNVLKVAEILGLRREGRINISVVVKVDKNFFSSTFCLIRYALVGVR